MDIQSVPVSLRSVSETLGTGCKMARTVDSEDRETKAVSQKMEQSPLLLPCLVELYVKLRLEH